MSQFHLILAHYGLFLSGLSPFLSDYSSFLSGYFTSGRQKVEYPDKININRDKKGDYPDKNKGKQDKKDDYSDKKLGKTDKKRTFWAKNRAHSDMNEPYLYSYFLGRMENIASLVCEAFAKHTKLNPISVIHFFPDASAIGVTLISFPL